VARRYATLAAVAAAVSLLGLLSATVVRGATSPAPRAVAAYAVAQHYRLPASSPADRRSGLPACEQRLEGAQPGGLPRLAVVGASFTAGVGSGPDQSWASLLVRHLRWDAVVYGVPGAGYVRAGAGPGGLIAAEVARIGLYALAPSLVIVQAGHDDIGVPPALEQQRVAQVVTMIRAEAPTARIVLLTVFAGQPPSAAAYRTDRVIVTAARAADRAVIIIDPLTGKWSFPRVRDGLHPTAAGSAWIAGQVAAILRDHGVRPVPPPVRPGRDPIVCDGA
jgi:lysophospholipase L1-like esterase